MINERRDSRNNKNYTSETPKAIVAGLNAKIEDIIYSTGKNGDIGLYLLMHVGTVLIHEPRPESRDLIARKKDLLYQGDFDGFRSISGYDEEAKARLLYSEKGDLTRWDHALARWYAHFSDEVLSSITKRITSDPEAFSIHDPAHPHNDHVRFDKMYLSNFVEDTTNLSQIKKSFDKLARQIPVGGLIYVNNHAVLANKTVKVATADYATRIKEMGPFKAAEYQPEQVSKILPSCLRIDEELTQNSYNLLEYGDVSTPGVYEKIK